MLGEGEPTGVRLWFPNIDDGIAAVVFNVLIGMRPIMGKGVSVARDRFPFVLAVTTGDRFFGEKLI